MASIPPNLPDCGPGPRSLGEGGRGRLKIFLGYTSGVGKSFRMLDEARRRLHRGRDIVVGAVQPRTQGDAAAVLAGLEVVPLRVEAGVAVMDLDAILRRRPEFCLVDGLAFDNPPTSFWPHRWQEIEILLQAGISVLASVNLQFIEERRVDVERITGRHFQESVPLAFLRQADEIELVDAPPDLPPPANSSVSLEVWRQRLSSLRELALLLAADVVDHQLEHYLRLHGIAPVPGAQERILVCMVPDLPAAAMLESARHAADRLHAELFAAYVRPGGAASVPQRLRENLAAASVASAQTVMLEGDDFVTTILDFAAQRGITQLFVGHSVHRDWWHRMLGGKLDRLIAGAHGMDVCVFPH